MALSIKEIPVSGPLDARLKAPPSKSVTQRALILAALADTPSTLLDPLDADDSRHLASALRDLGIPVRIQPESWIVEGQGGRLPNPQVTLDAGDAGTAARFLTALVALGNGSYVVDGSARMRQRPIEPLVEALRSLGVGARCLGAGGCPPVEVSARGLPGGSVRVKGKRSSQYLSALLLVSARAAGALRIEAEGPVSSSPYIRLTTSVMESFGVAPREEELFVFLQPAPRKYPGREIRIEGDYSSAGYFFAAAAITGGRVRVDNLNPRSVQADRDILEILERMGCGVERLPEGWALTGVPLRGVEADLTELPDAAPTLAVTALFAEGSSRFTGLSTLRIKETDRVAAVASEIRKLGGEVTEGPDFLEIRPAPLRGAVIGTYRDHRMAMSFALAGLRLEGVKIEDPGCVAKSFPTFWDELLRIVRPPV